MHLRRMAKRRMFGIPFMVPLFPPLYTLPLTLPSWAVKCQPADRLLQWAGDGGLTPSLRFLPFPPLRTPPPPSFPISSFTTKGKLGFLLSLSLHRRTPPDIQASRTRFRQGRCGQVFFFLIPLSFPPLPSLKLQCRSGLARAGKEILRVKVGTSSFSFPLIQGLFFSPSPGMGCIHVKEGTTRPGVLLCVFFPPFFPSPPPFLDDRVWSSKEPGEW